MFIMNLSVVIEVKQGQYEAQMEEMAYSPNLKP